MRLLRAIRRSENGRDREEEHTMRSHQPMGGQMMSQDTMRDTMGTVEK